MRSRAAIGNHPIHPAMVTLPIGAFFLVRMLFLDPVMVRRPLLEPNLSASGLTFTGISLLVNGVLVLGAGIYELLVPPAEPLVLASLHAPIWWGALMSVVGAAGTLKFAPRRAAAPAPSYAVK